MYPILTVDVIIENSRNIVLIRREKEPYKGKLALPGGFVEYGETVEAAAIREAKEETSLDVLLIDILGVYSSPDRDPRGHVISVVFVAKQVGGSLQGKNDALSAKWFELANINLEDLAFDHSKIIGDYKKWMKDKQTFWSTKQV